MTIVQPKVAPWREEDIVCPNCGYRDVTRIIIAGTGKCTLACMACKYSKEYDTLYDAYKASRDATTTHKE